MNIPKHSKLYPEFRKEKLDRSATKLFAVIFSALIAYTIYEIVKALHI